MASERSTPSIPVVAACAAAIAALGLFLLSAGGGDAELSEALSRTLDTGGRYTKVTDLVTPTITPQKGVTEGYTEPGTQANDLISDERTVLTNLELTKEAREVGSETIAAVATTHYAATVDLELQAEEAAHDAEARGGSASAGFDMQSIQDRPPRLDVWIDDTGLIRRFYVSESYRDGTMKASSTIDFHDFADGS